eukprot:TRINITY_DN2118_c2_g2_i1.p1 TRINITY_DN2118_c2_g2~~TRINITY_DN2118_c2_g2_i1.p1  ORF type:complete len:1487 (+),score=375.36 TRINITY_DN2118_c2_g2_i1:171-4463(+)
MASNKATEGEAIELVAKEAYSPREQKGHLSFEVGDRLVLIEEGGGKWWKGRKLDDGDDGPVGFFPKANVQFATESQQHKRKNSNNNSHATPTHKLMHQARKKRERALSFTDNNSNNNTFSEDDDTATFTDDCFDDSTAGDIDNFTPPATPTSRGPLITMSAPTTLGSPLNNATPNYSSLLSLSSTQTKPNRSRTTALSVRPNPFAAVMRDKEKRRSFDDNVVANETSLLSTDDNNNTNSNNNSNSNNTTDNNNNNKKPKGNYHLRTRAETLDLARRPQSDSFTSGLSHSIGGSTTPGAPAPLPLSSLSADPIDRQHERRRRIVEELLSTERTYISNLHMLIHEYKNPTVQWAEALENEKDRATITLERVNSVFGNIALIAPLHDQLLMLLEDRMRSWKPQQGAIANVFVTMAPFFKMYTSYVNNYDMALNNLSLLNKHKKFAAFLQTRKTPTEQVKGDWYLSHLLILPVQRIPRYQLLLTDLLKNTSTDHDDFADLTDSVRKISEIAHHINEKKKSFKRLQKMWAIHNKLVYPAGLMISERDRKKAMHLVKPSRELVKKGTVTNVSTSASGRRLTNSNITHSTNSGISGSGLGLESLGLAVSGGGGRKERRRSRLETSDAHGHHSNDKDFVPEYLLFLFNDKLLLTKRIPQAVGAADKNASLEYVCMLDLYKALIQQTPGYNEVRVMTQDNVVLKCTFPSPAKAEVWTKTIQYQIDDYTCVVRAANSKRPLHAACRDGDERALRALLVGLKNPGSSDELDSPFGDPNCKDPKGRTALHIAAKLGHLVLCQVLVEEFGVSPDIVADKNRLAIDMARSEGNVDIVEYLTSIANRNNSPRGGGEGEGGSSGSNSSSKSTSKKSPRALLKHATVGNKSEKHKLLAQFKAKSKSRKSASAPSVTDNAHMTMSFTEESDQRSKHSAKDETKRQGINSTNSSSNNWKKFATLQFRERKGKPSDTRLESVFDKQMDSDISTIDECDLPMKSTSVIHRSPLEKHSSVKMLTPRTNENDTITLDYEHNWASKSSNGVGVRTPRKSVLTPPMSPGLSPRAKIAAESAGSNVNLSPRVRDKIDSRTMSPKLMAKFSKESQLVAAEEGLLESDNATITAVPDSPKRIKESTASIAQSSPRRRRGHERTQSHSLAASSSAITSKVNLSPDLRSDVRKVFTASPPTASSPRQTSHEQTTTTPSSPSGAPPALPEKKRGHGRSLSKSSGSRDRAATLLDVNRHYPDSSPPPSTSAPIPVPISISISASSSHSPTSSPSSSPSAADVRKLRSPSRNSPPTPHHTTSKASSSKSTKAKQRKSLGDERLRRGSQIVSRTQPTIVVDRNASDDSVRGNGGGSGILAALRRAQQDGGSDIGNSVHLHSPTDGCGSGSGGSGGESPYEASAGRKKSGSIRLPTRGLLSRATSFNGKAKDEVSKPPPSSTTKT